MAGKATPSPSPMATRMATSAGTPSAAASGVKRVQRDQAVTPTASTPFPPYLSARDPAEEGGGRGRGDAVSACSRALLEAVCSCYQSRSWRAKRSS